MSPFPCGRLKGSFWRGGPGEFQDFPACQSLNPFSSRRRTAPEPTRPFGRGCCFRLWTNDVFVFFLSKPRTQFPWLPRPCSSKIALTLNLGIFRCAPYPPPLDSWASLAASQLASTRWPVTLFYSLRPEGSFPTPKLFLVGSASEC